MILFPPPVLGICEDATITVDFFSDDPAEKEHARQLCRLCPSSASCLRGALLRREAGGVWAGMDDKERLALIQRLDRSCPDCGAQVGPRRAPKMHTCPRCGGTRSGPESFQLNVKQYVVSTHLALAS